MRECSLCFCGFRPWTSPLSPVCRREEAEEKRMKDIFDNDIPGISEPLGETGVSMLPAQEQTTQSLCSSSDLRPQATLNLVRRQEPKGEKNATTL